MKVLRGVVLFVLLLSISVGAASCGGGGREATTISSSATPRELAELAGFHGVESAEIEVALEIDRYRKSHSNGAAEEINMRILGPFMGAGGENPPPLDLAIESRGDLGGRNVDFLSGPLWLPDKLVANFDGKVYEAPEATFEELKSKLEDAQEEGGAGDASACLKAAGDFDVTGVLRNLVLEGKSETLDGEPTKAVTADLDVPTAIDELIQLSEDPACKAQLEALGLPPVTQLEALGKQLEHSVISAPVRLEVDRNGVVRYLNILVNVELQHEEELEVELAVRLNQVNEVTSLAEAHGYSPFPALLKQFGLSQEDVERADGDEIVIGVLEVLSDRLFGRETG